MSGRDAGTDATLIGGLRSRLGARSPLAWILLTPLATLPVSGALLFTVGGAVDAEALGLTEREWVRFGGRFDRVNYFYFDFRVTCALLMGPGLLNLAAALWLFHGLTYVRAAAALALALALLRTFAAPLAAILFSSADLLTGAGLLIRVPIGESGVDSDPSAQLAMFRLVGPVWAGGLALWLVTFGAWWAYEPLTARFRPGWQAPRERGEGEPRSWGGFIARR